MLRFHKVTGYRPAASSEAPRPKRMRLAPEVKPALQGVAGRVADDEGATKYAQEPIFDPTPVFEIRIHYNNFDQIRRAALAKGKAQSDELEVKPEFFRAIPLETLLGRNSEDRTVRDYCLSRMLKTAQQGVESSNGNPAVRLVQLLRQINMHFDDLGSLLLCSNSEERSALAAEAMEQFSQGKPCHVEDLDDKEDEHASIVDAPLPIALNTKLESLRRLLEDDFKYELGRLPAGASSSAAPSTRELTVKNATIDLDDDDD